jgi:signal transduction histidine kinase
LISDRQENELEPYLEYSKQAEINGHYYSIKLRQSKFENRDLLIIMTLSLFVLLLSAMGISFIITRKMNKSVWANFELNLQKMEAFSFEGHHDLDLPVSGIDEFDRLNKVVNTLTRKLRQDYLSLKELTENASHEIQTPLAIVLLNLEEILQKDISPDMFKKVVTSINALKRLSTLNSSLLLLTKIENGQYEALEKVDMNEIIKQKILEFKPLYEDLNISLNLHEEQEFVIDIDRRLAEIVVNNLLSNAIKYNLPDGNIDIMITFDKLKICNTGQKNDLSEKNIFNRFTKGSSSSSGLGLSIVKSICNIYGLQIRYSKSDLHCFSLSIRH